MHDKVIHVAAENPSYRDSLKTTIERLGIGDVVVASTEGSVGTVAVRRSRPAILVVSTSIEEDTVEHLRWYRAAAPQAHIIGFAFTEGEAEGLRKAGVETVVSSKISRPEIIALLQDIDRKTSR